MIESERLARASSLPRWYTPERVQRFHQLGLWGQETLFDFVRSNAERQPDRLCVYDGRRRLSFAEAHDTALRLAQSLSDLGVGRGDRVLVQLPNWWEAVVAYYAIARLGAVFVPRMTIYREHEVRDAAQRTSAKALLIADRFRGYAHAQMAMSVKSAVPSIAHVVVTGEVPEGALAFGDLLSARAYSGPEPHPDDLHIILFSSGTTAQPKGVQHSFNTYVSCAKTLRNGLAITADDRCFMPSPIMHNTGLNSGVLVPALTGGGTVLQDIWNADSAMRLIHAEECTYSIGATPFVTMMLDAYHPEQHDLSALRVFVCGGAPVPAPVVQEAITTLGFELVTCFGQSECSAYTMTRLGDSAERVASSDGVATIGNEIIVTDANGRQVSAGVEGEICCRGAQIMLGYLGEPELTQETIDAEGFCHSGDLGRMDEDGYIRITGRKKDIIIRGGTNISALEIEELLLEHPAVADVAVVGYPDRVLGERACAFVVAKPGERPTLEDLVKFLSAKDLAKQKLPERLELVDALPITASGKVEKFRLRAALQPEG